MKKKYVALTVGVAAAMAVGAPVALAADLPGFPGAESNGGTCTFQDGTAQSSSNVPAITIPPLPVVSDSNEGNCQSFGNDRNNGVNSGQDLTQLPTLPGLPTGGLPQ